MACKGLWHVLDGMGSSGGCSNKQKLSCEDCLEFPASVPDYSHWLQGVKSRGWFTGVRWSLDLQDPQPYMDDCEHREGPPGQPALEQEYEDAAKEQA